MGYQQTDRRSYEMDEIRLSHHEKTQDNCGQKGEHD